MIEWHKDIYVDDIVAEDIERYKQLVADDRVCIPALYCILPASNENNLLDIMSCNEMLFAHYKRNKLRIIGIAVSYKNAVVLVQRIVMDTYNVTGGFDVRKYLGIYNGM